MGKINLDSCNRGLNKVRGVGMPFNMLTGTFDFNGDYPGDGEEFNLKPYFPKIIIGVLVFPKDGYIFEYKDGKIKAYCPTVGHSHSIDAEDNETGSIHSKPAAEVNEGVDLSELKNVRFMAFGY